MRILGMHLDENCTASTGFQRVTRANKQIVHALRIITNRTRGVNEQKMRQFAQAFLVSRIMYGLPYHPVNRTQMLPLDRLLNEPRRIVTGLPRYTRLDALKSCSKLNNLPELVDMHTHAQETRLRATNSGRYALMLLGYDLHKLPALPNKTPPWEVTVLTDGSHFHLKDPATLSTGNSERMLGPSPLSQESPSARLIKIYSVSPLQREIENPA